jgi:hypothetical protein
MRSRFRRELKGKELTAVFRADVAQLVEHSLGKGEVTSSILVIGSRVEAFCGRERSGSPQLKSGAFSGKDLDVGGGTPREGHGFSRAGRSRNRTRLESLR